MKTIDLERRRFLRQMDKAYPKENSPGFTERVKLVWQNLDDDYYIEKLSREFKPNRGKINKLTLFYLWLFLCIERPWEKERKYILDEKQGKNIYNKFYDISDKLGVDFPDAPNPNTLKKHLKRENFDQTVSWIAIDPKELVAKLGKVFIKLEKKISLFQKNVLRIGQKYFKKIDFEYAKLFYKSLKFIELKKHISKRDLMRKLGINKKDCDSLLREAERQGLVRIKQFPQNSVWIIYTGP